MGRRWTLALAALPPMVGIVTAVFAPEPHGHWVEHLSPAAVKITQAAALAVFAVLLRRAWTPFLLLGLSVVLIGIALQVVGDVAVARSIWRTAGDPGFGTGYGSGHETSSFGDLVVLVGGLGFAIFGGVTRRMRGRVAVPAALLAIVPPPFFWPAVGILAAMLHAFLTGSEFRPIRRSPRAVGAYGTRACNGRRSLRDAAPLTR